MLKSDIIIWKKVEKSNLFTINLQEISISRRKDNS
jgi:hypothetical protein